MEKSSEPSYDTDRNKTTAYDIWKGWFDMSKKGTKLGTASVLFAGAGAAALAVKKSRENAQ